MRLPPQCFSVNDIIERVYIINHKCMVNELELSLLGAFAVCSVTHKIVILSKDIHQLTDIFPLLLKLTVL